jgi:hypothetical protein
MSIAKNPMDPPTGAQDDPAEDLRRLEAEAEALRAAGRHDAAAQLLAWRDLHALRVGREGKSRT